MSNLEPAAFVHAQMVRQQRKAKIERAKRRLGAVLQNLSAEDKQMLAKSAVNISSFQSALNGHSEADTFAMDSHPKGKRRRRRTGSDKENGLTKKLKRTDEVAQAEAYKEEEEELDDEDLKIEKLLLLGVDEAQLLDGYYAALEGGLCTGAATRADLDSVDLCENDLPDVELHKYLLTKEEVNQYARVKAPIIE